MLKRPCLDCGRLTTGSRCPDHTRAHQRTRDLARRDDPMRQLRRSSAWRRLSEQARAQQPWCSVPGCHDLDLTADHIISPLLGGGPLDPNNVQVLCRTHQNRKGDQQRRRFPQGR
jgi:5-methylcytosine-specific restriction enzyme A